MKRYVILTFILAGAVLLAGCRSAGMSYSAEDAAIKTIMNIESRDTMIDPESIEVLQSVPYGDRVFVMVTFGGVRPDWNMGNMKCLYLYEVQRRFLGMWAPGSGGGGCSGQVGGGQVDDVQPNDIPPQLISIQGGQSTNGPLDPGTSTLSGQVFDDRIRSVQVFWSDGTNQTVGVVNGSYLVIRDGKVSMTRVDALDGQQNILFSDQPEVAPGKK